MPFIVPLPPPLSWRNLWMVPYTNVVKPMGNSMILWSYRNLALSIIPELVRIVTSFLLTFFSPIVVCIVGSGGDDDARIFAEKLLRQNYHRVCYLHGNFPFNLLMISYSMIIQFSLKF